MTRGVYTVAFGKPARQCALRLIASIRRYMPGLPVAVAASETLGVEDVFVSVEDTDVGARRAKLRAYDLAPASWETILYLDADTEITAPVYQLFEWAESGWDLVICRDVGDTLHSFQRKNNLPELYQLRASVGTLFATQFNGGVWAIRRSPETQAFMARWLAEWEVHAQRDQGALLRALYAEPMRVLVLGHEWNTMVRHCPNTRTAGVLHHTMEARRWVGKLPGRIDSPEAWAIVHAQAKRGGR
jgi:hypothetical protein